MARGSLSDAERHFSKALRLAPDAAAIHYNLGEVSLRQNQIDDARHAYEAAIERDMVKSCVWGSGGFLGDLDAVLEGDSSDDVG